MILADVSHIHVAVVIYLGGGNQTDESVYPRCNIRHTHGVRAIYGELDARSH